MPSPRLPAVACLLLVLGGCAQGGDFPSLAPRPVETELPGADIAPPETVIADDPQLASKLQLFVDAGRKGDADFAAALAEARAAVGRAGKAGSDSWIEAQQAVSRVEAARGATASALADLDAFAVDQAKARPLGEGDMAAIRAATAELQHMANAQQQQVAALQARLGK